ncbi:MaoC family dehydratase N-terminal domain-containing protein [Alcaligenaceae bacterium]|nr:MaoC family dehydratase N-terminal domain-containing protein [Alcaligenaceae bacterium]
MVDAVFDPHALLARKFSPVRHDYSERDCMLFSLGCGLGQDPLDAGQLRYVYEGEKGGLAVFPVMVNVLGYSGFWADQPDTGIAWRKLVHAEQAIVLHRPLSAQGSVIGRNRVLALHDKGIEKGALMLQEREIVDAASGEMLAQVMQTTLLRGNGGSGAKLGPIPRAPHPMPHRVADAVCDLSTLPQAALLYRLNGDLNPLHADPVVAAAAGFPRPILHGLATMGVAAHAVLKTMLGYDERLLRAMRVRFTAPVFPGDTLRTEMWRDGDVVSLRTIALERSVQVLGAGRIDLA